jgi:hypothetical protein
MALRPEDPVLTSSRREALVVLAIWATACTYTVGYCALFGYERDLASLRYVAGVPDWVFWGVFVPWSVCTVLSFWVSNFLIKDQDLGPERAETRLESEIVSDKEADHA